MQQLRSQASLGVLLAIPSGHLDTREVEPHFSDEMKAIPDTMRLLCCIGFEKITCSQSVPAAELKIVPPIAQLCADLLHACLGNAPSLGNFAPVQPGGQALGDAPLPVRSTCRARFHNQPCKLLCPLATAPGGAESREPPWPLLHRRHEAKQLHNGRGGGGHRMRGLLERGPSPRREPPNGRDGR